MTKVASEQQVVDAVFEARSSRTSFEITASGSKRAFGRPTRQASAPLDVSGLSGIVSYEPNELIITARPGTPVAEIQRVLAAKKQRLGFDPPDLGALFGVAPEIGTLGGAISADISGPARIRYGSVRDQLLGIRAVNGFGEAFKAGGKVVKNVTGFDIPKLVCGAFGTLCILTEVTLRVFPKPSKTQTFMAQDMSAVEGFALLRKIWSSSLEATGLAYADDSVLIRLEGEDVSLGEKVGVLKSLCVRHNLQSVDDNLFEAIANGTKFVGVRECVWRVAVPPSRAHEVIGSFGSSTCVGDCAGGILWIGTDEHERLRSVVKACGGYAVLVRGNEAMSEAIDVFEVENDSRAQLTRSVKIAFDPLGLFNPGRMWAGI